MAIVIGKTTVRLSAMSAEDTGAAAVVRFFPTLAALQLATAPRQGTRRPTDLGGSGDPRFPGDLVVGTMRRQPGRFCVETCLEWSPGGDGDAAREAVVHEALRRAVPAIVGEAERWGATTVAFAPLPEGRSVRDLHARYVALWDALRRAASGAALTVTLCVRDAAQGRLVARALKGQGLASASAATAAQVASTTPAPAPAAAEERGVAVAVAPTAPSVNDQSTVLDAPALVVETRPRGPRRVSTLLDDREARTDDDPATLDQLPLFDTGRARRPPDDASLIEGLPTPFALAWHLALRQTEPEARLKAIQRATDTVLRAVFGVLVCDYLGGPPEAAVDKALKRLSKSKQGDWSKAVEALAGAVISRPEPAPFLVELPYWWVDRADDPNGVAKRLVELRNDDVHWRRGAGATAARDHADAMEDLLRRYLRSLTWLLRYELVTVVDHRLTPDKVFVGYWEIYRGRDLHPAPEHVTWRGDLAEGACYLLDRERGRAMRVDPFIAFAGEGATGERVPFVVEHLPKPNRVVRQRVFANTTEKLALPDDLWAGHQARVEPVEVLIS